MRRLTQQEMIEDPTPVPELERFTGAAFSCVVNSGVASKATSALIRLPDGSRGHWHRHSEGQLVHVVSGRGYVGRRNEEPLAIDEGDTIWIEPDEEHWHGSAEGVELAQLAVSFGAITWLEPS
ncbi:cupin domain-containing protein [Kribbella sp. NPDC050241]|uniref:cupin domain-containing protein n=1 Tax=Kribbella sp. NPDC050241 TaxID=3364115 RepID=UPI0037BD1E67